MDVKSEVCSFDNLYKAMRHCKQNVMWKDSVAGFVKNGLANIYRLQSSLEDDTYKIDRYTHFKVYEPKERDIVSTRIKDRVFQRSFCANYFYEQMTKSFIYDNVACQIGKGNEFGRKRLVSHLQRFYRKHGTDGWVLKIDIKNFFGSTPHSLALKAVTDHVSNPWAVKMVKQVIDSYNHGEDPEVGMGLGSEMTQLIQLAVLNELDHYIKERLRIKHYIRYNDDMILIHEDKDYLKECKKVIAKWLSDHALRIHPKKTQLFKVTQSIRFLGFRYRLTDTGKVIMTLLPEKVAHERRKLTRLVAKADEGVLTRDDVDVCYQSWKAYAGNHHHPGSVGKKAHRHTHNLILKMDQHYKNLWKEK